MPEASKNTEKRILEACAAAKRVQKPNISALAREYGVSYPQLRGRLNGRQPHSARHATHKTLEDFQERALIRWIQQLDDYGVSLTPKVVEEAANEVLRRNTPDNERAPRVGNAWVYRFTTRLPKDWHFTKQKPIDRKRLSSSDIGLQTAWFDQLEIAMRNIPSYNIYNFDETGFQLGQGKAQKVITRYPQRAARGNPSSEGRESVTAIECVCADGTDIPPYFIFSGKYHLQKWYESDNIPDNYKVNLSETGYSNDHIAFQWIQHFHQYTKHKIKRNQKRLLLFDGHGSHLTYEFIAFCHEYNIIPFCFLPKTTHFIQPLDGQIFQAYKHHYKTNNNRIAIRGGLTTDKADFLDQIPTVRASAFTQKTIRDSFSKRGIYPLRPHLILDKLEAERNSTPELQIFDGDTPPLPSSSTNSPPQTIRTLRRSINKAQDYIQDSPELHQGFKRRLDRLFQSSLETAELAATLKSDYYTNALPAAKTKNTSRKTVPKAFGELQTKHAKRRIAVDKEQEAKRVENRARKRQRPLGATPPPPPPIGPIEGIPDTEYATLPDTALWFIDDPVVVEK